MDTLIDRRNRLAAALVDFAGADVTPARMVQAAAGLLSVDSAALTVAGAGSHLVSAHGSLAEGMEDLQRRLGEGPTLTALDRNSPVLATAADAAASRWPAFDARAIDAGVVSVLALPLRPRRVPPSALSLYTTAPGALDDERIGDALVVADLVAEALTNPSRDGLHQRLAQVGDDSSAVHQATGILAARHSLTPAEALSSLRGQAATSGAALGDLAAEIAGRGR